MVEVSQSDGRRRVWPYILANAGIVGLIFTWPSVVPENELIDSDFFAIGFSVGLAACAAGLSWNIWHSLRRNIRRTSDNNLSVGVAWTLLALYYLGTFSSFYWIESVRDVGAFSEPLTHDDAIYFALATFTTTGYGDITPVSAIARWTVSAQMVLAFVLVAVLLVLALSRWPRASSSSSGDSVDPEA